MVHTQAVPICTTIAGSHSIVMLMLRDGLGMCMLVSSMMRMLLLVMSLLLVVPRRVSLRVLLLVREDMLWVDHFGGRRVIRWRSDAIVLDVQVLSGDKHRQEQNIMETLEASEV